MNRRAFIAVLGGSILAVPLASRAGQGAAIPRIGYLNPSAPPRSTAWFNAFRDGLREHGYIDGTNVLIEPRFADGYERVPGLIADLLNLKVDVLVVVGTAAAVAAQRATSTVPIVFAPAADPVGSGLVASLSRPGGNITGYTDVPTELSQKSLGLLSEVVPRMSRVGVLWHGDNPGSRIVSNQLASAARQIGLKLYQVEVRHTADLEAAFTTLTKARVQALIAIADIQLNSYASAVAELARSRRLPLLVNASLWPRGGALLSYGVLIGGQNEYSRQAAAYVVKILHGAKPADLPVEQPTTYKLVVNLKTAKALGLAIPQWVLVQADQVIE